MPRNANPGKIAPHGQGYVCVPLNPPLGMSEEIVRDEVKWGTRRRHSQRITFEAVVTSPG